MEQIAPEEIRKIWTSVLAQAKKDVVGNDPRNALLAARWIFCVSTHQDSHRTGAFAWICERVLEKDPDWTAKKIWGSFDKQTQERIKRLLRN